MSCACTWSTDIAGVGDVVAACGAHAEYSRNHAKYQLNKLASCCGLTGEDPVKEISEYIQRLQRDNRTLGESELARSCSKAEARIVELQQIIRESATQLLKAAAK